MIIKPMLFLLRAISLIALLPLVLQAQTHSPNTAPEKFQDEALKLLQGFEDKMNLIQDSFFEPEQIRESIRYSYTGSNDQLFLDSLVPVLNDLEPAALRSERIPVWQYLLLLDTVYQKTESNSVRFFNQLPGPVEFKKDFVLVPVFYNSKFESKNKYNPMPYLKMAKKAEIVFMAKSGYWTPYIKSIDILSLYHDFSDQDLTSYFSDKKGVVGDIIEKMFKDHYEVMYGSAIQSYFTDSASFKVGQVTHWYYPSLAKSMTTFKNDRFIIGIDDIQAKMKDKSIERITFSPDGIMSRSSHFQLNFYDHGYNVFFNRADSIQIYSNPGKTRLMDGASKSAVITRDTLTLNYKSDHPFDLKFEKNQASVFKRNDKVQMIIEPESIEVDFEGFKRVYHFPDCKELKNFILVQGSNYLDENMNRVSISDFYMQQHEVTVSEFKKFVDATGYISDAEKNGYSYCVPVKNFNPPRRKKFDAEVVIDSLYGLIRVANVNWRNDIFGFVIDQSEYHNYPVVHVSWNDAVQYANWKGMRLPTEKEWKYAETGGLFLSEERFKISEMSAYDKTTRMTLAKKATFQPNQLVLYDMLGNVSEWLSDEKNQESCWAVGGCFASEKKDIEGTLKERSPQKNISYCVTGFRCIIPYKE